MATLREQVFDDLRVDHVEVYVNDIVTTTQWLIDGFRFAVYATADESATPALPGGAMKIESGPATGSRSVGIGGNDIRLVLTEPLDGDHPAAAYVDRHGDGVADIALRVADAVGAFDEAVRRGAVPVARPERHGDVVTATIVGFGDVTHTFVQRAGDVDERMLPGLRPRTGGGKRRSAPGGAAGLSRVDHFAVCLEAGKLDPTVEFYESVLGFDMVFTERIALGSQAMDSKVVRSKSGAVTLTMLEPDVSRAPGQIDEFIQNHGGPGVQHVAFAAEDIVHAIKTITSGGVEFLSTPASYYELLDKRLDLTRHSVHDLRRHNILVDEDPDGQLFQIFARSVHPRNTLFFEVIERRGATTFGSGNARALYEAVEYQRAVELRQSEGGAA